MVLSRGEMKERLESSTAFYRSRLSLYPGVL